MGTYRPWQQRITIISCMAGTVCCRNGEETSKISHADMGLSLRLKVSLHYGLRLFKYCSRFAKPINCYEILRKMPFLPEQESGW